MDIEELVANIEQARENAVAEITRLRAAEPQDASEKLADAIDIRCHNSVARALDTILGRAATEGPLGL